MAVVAYGEKLIRFTATTNAIDQKFVIEAAVYHGYGSTASTVELMDYASTLSVVKLTGKSDLGPVIFPINGTKRPDGLNLTSLTDGTLDIHIR